MTDNISFYSVYNGDGEKLAIYYPLVDSGLVLAYQLRGGLIDGDHDFSPREIDIIEALVGAAIEAGAEVTR